MQPHDPHSGAARVLAGVMSAIFGGIGIAVLVFVWGAEGFHAPPTFFKVFASFIATAFIASAAFGIYQAVQGRPFPRRLAPRGPRRHRRAPAQGTVGYSCPSCGAGLGESAEISPSGDAKCLHCKGWFNVRTGA